jgi:hypothetical protein
MEIRLKTDTEIIDFILSIFYSDGKYVYVPLTYINEEVNKISNEIHPWDITRIIDNLIKQGLIKKVNITEGLTYAIDANGMIIMRQHGSYSNYLEYIKKDEIKKTRSEKFDRSIRNGNIIAAVLISLMTLILTQCPIGNSKQQEKIEHGIQSIAAELDSLKQILENHQSQSKKTVVQDTATSK